MYHTTFLALLEIRLTERTSTATVLAAPCSGADAVKPGVCLHACTTIPARAVIAVAPIWIGATTTKFFLKKEEQEPRKPKTRKGKQKHNKIKQNQRNKHNNQVDVIEISRTISLSGSTHSEGMSVEDCMRYNVTLAFFSTIAW